MSNLLIATWEKWIDANVFSWCELNKFSSWVRVAGYEAVEIQGIWTWRSTCSDGLTIEVSFVGNETRN